MAEKLKPIEIEGSRDEVEKTINDLIDKCHTVFKTSLSKDSKPPLGDREIFIPFTWIDNKAEIFWHIASLETQTNLSIKPCNNEISSYYCDSNCVSGMMKILLNNGEERSKCIYRAVRVGWIKAIIMMFNENDKRVKYWEKVHSNGRNRIYLRYQEGENDFIVVFEEKSEKRVVLITAFPVFYISASKDYETDYQNYIKTIQ